MFTNLNNPLKLWRSFEDHMTQCNNYSLPEAKRCTFKQINTFLQSNGKQLLDYNILPNEIYYAMKQEK